MAAVVNVGVPGNVPPLDRGFTLNQDAVANDMITIKLLASATGNPLNILNASVAEFTVGPNGALTIVDQAAADIPIKVTSAASPTGKLIQLNNVATEVFSVGPNGAVVINDLAAADVLIKATQAGSPSGDAIQILNSSASKVFQVDVNGRIRTMVLQTLTLSASLASNGSQTYALTGITTSDVVFTAYQTAPKAGDGLPYASCQTAGNVNIFAPGVTVSTPTLAFMYYKTVAN